MLFGIEDCWISSGLLSFIDLFDKSVDGLACLDGHILILLNKIDIEFIEKLYIVFGGYKITL